VISEIWLWSLERENGARKREYIDVEEDRGKGRGTTVKNLDRGL